MHTVLVFADVYSQDACSTAPLILESPHFVCVCYGVSILSLELAMFMTLKGPQARPCVNNVSWVNVTSFAEASVLLYIVALKLRNAKIANFVPPRTSL